MMEMIESIDWSAVLLSVEVAVCTACFSLPLAIAVGYFLARKSFRGKAVVEGIITLPMVLPPVTTGFILLIIFRVNGPIGQFIENVFHISIPFSFFAAVLAASIVSFPLMVRSVKVSMQMVDVNFEQASMSLGASKWQTFIRITMPLSWPGILSGFILSFARSLGEFGATITFAGNIEGVTRTLPLAIYAKMQVPGKDAETFALVGVSVAISFLAIMISEGIHKRRNSMLNNPTNNKNDHGDKY